MNFGDCVRNALENEGVGLNTQRVHSGPVIWKISL